MTAEDASALLERFLESQSLSQTQEAIFRRVWERQSYVESAIATGDDHGYIKDTGAQLWRRLSQVSGQKVTPNNLRNVISAIFHKSEPAQEVPARCRQTGFPQSWGEAVDVGGFCGRVLEQAFLENWVAQDICRLVALLGIGGVGKTALSIKLANPVQAQFDSVVWRSLRQAPPLSELLPEIIPFLSAQQDTQVSSTAPRLIEHLMAYLHHHRCLLVLDNLASILRTGKRAGGYRSGYEDYGGLSERLADEAHRSCLLITSREKPKGLSLREGDGLPVRSLQLTGLDQPASQEIISGAGLDGLGRQHAVFLSATAVIRLHSRLSLLSAQSWMAMGLNFWTIGLSCLGNYESERHEFRVNHG